jgi:putative Mg2+ transporter-C (MgtC) family protein
MLSHAELILRIAVGAAFGAIVGIERNRTGRQAGVRMHLIVAMASATFMVISAHFAFFQDYVAGPEKMLEVDPSRIAASVVTGIGFLAGGAILRTGANVQGLTTAAGLWLVTAAGMCAGAGMFAEGVFVTGTGVFALNFLRRFEHKDILRRRVRLVMGDTGPERLRELTDRMCSLGATVSDFDYDRCLDHHESVLTFDVRLPPKVHVSELIGLLEAHPGVVELRVEAPS